MEISCFEVEESKELAVIQEFELEEGIFTDILDKISPIPQVNKNIQINI